MNGTMGKITSIDVYIVAVNGTDETAYLSEGEADSFVRATLEMHPDADVVVEKKIAHLANLKRTEDHKDVQK